MNYTPANDRRTDTVSFSPVDEAAAAFRDGEPVLVHDFATREGETDLVYPAATVSANDVARLRNDAGGLVCVALSHETATSFDLPFLQDALDHPAAQSGHLGYDDRSSFSLTVNHRETVTGIPDEERAYTIGRLANAARNATETDFAAEFRAPGHVHLLRAAPGLLSDRRGHTELGVTFAEAAGRSPAVVVCEMLDDTSGEALSREDAATYAEANDYPFVDGTQIVDRFD